jgi:hypothetical protein
MVSLRLSKQARFILERLARQQGISQAAVLEVLLRREAAASALGSGGFTRRRVRRRWNNCYACSRDK